MGKFSGNTLSLLCIHALHIHEILEVQTVPDGHLGEFVLGNESGINHLSFRGVFCCGELIKICHGGRIKKELSITPDIPPPAADMLFDAKCIPNGSVSHLGFLGWSC